MATIKPKEKFDNPFVLSFFANTCYAACFVPQDYYTSFEFRRLKFTATGQVNDPSDAVKQMIIGGLIICRVMCKEILFNSSKYLTEVAYAPEASDNLDMLGSILYKAFNDIVKEAREVMEDNTAVVTLNEEPLPVEAGIGWKEEMDGTEATTEDILNGVPDPTAYSYDTEAVNTGMTSFLESMARYVQMQAEDERLPLFKKKFEAMKELANKARRTDGDLYDLLTDTVKQREQELKIP